ncbi:FecR family protein [Pedobacter jeongneungensis]|uniref:FecR family protein n=1 Tax=Pedobacter jeongneungensis TaxID=947309 RepID=UPI000469401D|nr:FecR domain-containing protein [Pedobacter jeongneungensis]
MDHKTEKKALIRKYINGECSAEEIAEIKSLLATDDLSVLFDEVMDEIAASTVDQYNEPDLEYALDKFHEKQSAENIEGNILPLSSKNIKLRRYLSYAAAVLVIIGSISLLIPRLGKKTQQYAQVYQHFENPNGKRSRILLPDSSVVYLGSGSTLSFPSKFAANMRAISLRGEAFFEVTKNPKRPFIIHTGNIVTRVLGTSFKVDAFLNQPVSVLVSTGKVRVDREVNKVLHPIAVLLPGQSVVWNEKTGQRELGSTPVSDILGWKNGKLVFRKTKLADIATILERTYNVAIAINNSAIAERQIRVNLTTDIPLSKLIKILSVAGNFNYKINQNHVSIF